MGSLTILWSNWALIKIIVFSDKKNLRNSRSQLINTEKNYLDQKKIDHQRNSMHPLPLRDSVKLGCCWTFSPMQCIQITSLTAWISFFQQLQKRLWLWPLFWCFTAPFLGIQTELTPTDSCVPQLLDSSQKGVCRNLWPNQNLSCNIQTERFIFLYVAFSEVFSGSDLQQKAHSSHLFCWLIASMGSISWKTLFFYYVQGVTRTGNLRESSGFLSTSRRKMMSGDCVRL